MLEDGLLDEGMFDEGMLVEGMDEDGMLDEGMLDEGMDEDGMLEGDDAIIFPRALHAKMYFKICIFNQIFYSVLKNKVKIIIY